MKNLLLAITTILTLSLMATQTFATENTSTIIRAKIIEIIEEKPISQEQIAEISQIDNLKEQKLLIELKTGERMTIENNYYGQININQYKKGDRVIVAQQANEEETTYYIQDYDRINPIIWLAIAFTLTAVIIGGKSSIRSIFSMIISFAIIFLLILPPISKGANPILIVVGYSLILVPITFYTTHGFNRKTTVAVIGTAISLIITGILATIFVNATHLTGYTNEEAMFLNTLGSTQYDLRKILLAGIIISMLGVLDDVTVAQAEVVQQLKSVNERLKKSELFSKAMHVGRTHIASMINTLVLVYAGASFTLLLLFLGTNTTTSEVLNMEMVATEIVRTLIGSIGLILAVPLTTLLAVYNKDCK